MKKCKMIMRNTFVLIAIGLQIHDKGMQVEFKDIRLKQLETKGGI